MSLFWISALLALASPAPGQSSSGRVLHVPAEYSQIQAAIEASVDGDTVLVDPGHYYENINYRGKDIVVTSRYARTGDSSDVERTIIDGSRPRYPDSGSVVIITNPRQGRPVIQGFTITGGSGTNWRDPRNGGLYREGGGILSEFASPRILHNIIVGNTAMLVGGGVRSAGGGAMRCGNGEPEIAGNVIAGNRGGYGGGVVLYYTAANVHNNVIVRNVGGYSFGGGGLWIAARLARGSPNMITNNTIADNHAVGDTTGVADTNKVDDTNGRGGAMLVYSGGVYANAVILRNNIIWGNTQRAGGAIAGDTLAVTTTFSDVQGGWRGVGNISVDPNAALHTNVRPSRDSAADTRVATALLNDFKQAWHSADGVKLGNLFTEDGDLIIPTGELFHGRSTVAGFYSSVFAHGYRGSSTSAVISQLRHVTDDVMIVDATWVISGAVTAKGTPKPPERGILSVTLKRDGARWLVDALREQTSATRIVPSP